MPRFTMKVPGLTQIFELDEREKTVSVTNLKGRKVVFEETFAINELVPEYGEFAPPKPRLFPLILAWSVVILGCALMGAVLFFMIRHRNGVQTHGTSAPPRPQERYAEFRGEGA